MNKSESKYRNTAGLMDRALLLLLDKKDFDYITVKEVCQKAGVNRSTFYLHYESMTDLLEESIEYLYSDLKNKYSRTEELKIKGSSLDELLLFTPEYSVPYLQFLKENKKVFMTAVTNPKLFGAERTFDGMYRNLFLPILEAYRVPDREKKYLVRFYMSGIHAIVIEWIKGGCADEIPFIAELIVRCIRPEK